MHHFTWKLEFFSYILFMTVAKLQLYVVHIHSFLTLQFFLPFLTQFSKFLLITITFSLRLITYNKPFQYEYEWMNKWNTYISQQCTWLCYINLQLSRIFSCKQAAVELLLTARKLIKRNTFFIKICVKLGEHKMTIKTYRRNNKNMS